MANNSWTTDDHEGQGSSKRIGLHKRKTSTSKPKVMFQSQTWSSPAIRHRTTFKSNPAAANKRASSDPTASRPVTKQQSRFASLFMSLLAVSPMAIEYDAANKETMDAAQKAAVQPTQPVPPKKARIGRTSGARPSEIRKTRWKRFKYEMGLKIKSTGRVKGKDRRKWTQADDVELEEMRPEEWEAQTAMARDRKDAST
jgi:hypothetical protein